MQDLIKTKAHVLNTHAMQLPLPASFHLTERKHNEREINVYILFRKSMVISAVEAGVSKEMN